MAPEARWGFEEGDEIVEGLHALQLLGGGIEYEAYLAWSDRLLSTVVAKILRPDRVAESGSLRTLRKERDALNTLNHPCLPRCFGDVLEGERPHIQLEFVEGPRLSTLLRKFGPLPVEQLLPLGTQLCAAIHYMAGEGMAHLDVKPRNIIMSAPPRLIDLSVARTLERASEARHPVGTNAYMAPEQCAPGEVGVMGPKSDVWGVGVTLYEALTRHLAFPEGKTDANGDREAEFPQLVHRPAPLPEDIPEALTAPIMACLRPRPEDRPTASELAGMLEPLVAMLPTRRIISRLRPSIR